MPKYEVELRRWIEFSTVVEVSAPSRSRAGAIARDAIWMGSEWSRTGNFRKVTVATVSKDDGIDR